MHPPRAGGPVWPPLRGTIQVGAAISRPHEGGAIPKKRADDIRPCEVSSVQILRRSSFMNIKPFLVEEWMNEYEVGAKYNIAETCVDSVSLDELFALTGEDKGGLSGGAVRPAAHLWGHLRTARLQGGDLQAVPGREARAGDPHPRGGGGQPPPVLLPGGARGQGDLRPAHLSAALLHPCLPGGPRWSCCI